MSVYYHGKEIPPPPPEEWDKVYAALGRSTSHWGHVEGELAKLYSAAFSISDSYRARLAFWSIQSFGAKLKATDVILNHFCASHPELHGTWKDLRERCEKASTERNKLAHGMVVAEFNKNTLQCEVRLHPHYHLTSATRILHLHAPLPEKTKNKAWRQPKPLGITEIDELGVIFAS